MTRQITELIPDWSMAPVATAIQAMRGVALINAVTVVAEVGDFARFGNPRQLMAYFGLVPSEHSGGSRVRRVGITKAGNVQARRALIEGAWTYRMLARVSRKLHDRLEALPPDIRDIASAPRIYPSYLSAKQEIIFAVQCQPATTFFQQPALMFAVKNSDAKILSPAVPANAIGTSRRTRQEAETEDAG